MEKIRESLAAIGFTLEDCPIEECPDIFRAKRRVGVLVGYKNGSFGIEGCCDFDLNNWARCHGGRITAGSSSGSFVGIRVREDDVPGTMVEKPQFVEEVEQHTGLQCELCQDVGWKTDWWVVSPTGVRLFKVGGASGTIGSISQPDMYEVHGISDDERHRRRRS